MSTDDILKFDAEKLDLNDFNLDMSSTIPEHELLEFASFESPHDISQQQPAHGNFHVNPEELNQSHPQIINPSSLSHSYHEKYEDDDFGLTTKHLDPNQLLQDVSGSFNTDYLSPVGSPYSSASFQPQSIQQSLSKSLQQQRLRQGSISNSISNSFQQHRHDSIYDTLDVSSPQPHNLTDFSSNPAYFSPANNKTIPQRHGSISINSIASPNSYNDSALSPYNSSFDPSSFKSPRSLGVSPAPGSSLTSQSLPKSQLTKEDKLRRRREFHNQVERRRRDLIKEKIKELGLTVPPSLLYVDSEGKEVKASKSVIINRTVDYVVHLHKVMAEQQKRRAILERKIEEIESQFGALTTNNSSNVTPSTATSQQDTTTNNTANNNNNYVNNNNNSIKNSATPQSIQGTNSSYNNSPLGDFKIEDELQGDFNAKIAEFDVNEFLKEHNQTWNHNV